MLEVPPTSPIEPEPHVARFYLDVMRTLDQAEVPFLVGGGYAMAHYAGIARNTKDLDLFIKPSDRDRALAVLALAGHQTEYFYEFWISKAVAPDGAFVDFLYSSGNGLCVVDDEWFTHSTVADVLGRPAKIVPAEEQLWSKAFVQDRDRYDGADVQHIILIQRDKLDWERLLRRFDGHEAVLFAHLTLFAYAYPGEKEAVPAAVMERLAERMRTAAPLPEKVCRGPFLAQKSYTVALQQWGFNDGRLIRFGGYLSPDQVEQLPDR